MQVNFRQGIVSAQDNFLSKNSNDGIDINVNNKPVVLNIAHKDTNYLFYESRNITDAWTSIFIGTYSWLYWDINPSTGERTFGQTSIQPIVQSSLPSNSQVDSFGIPYVTEGRHWFNPDTYIHYVRVGTQWRNVIRVFAGYITPNFTSFNPMTGSSSFFGSQISRNPLTFSGRILFDDVGKPLIRNNGTFATTEQKIFANGLRVDAFRLESNVVHAIATQNMTEFTIVALEYNKTCRIATYNDIFEKNIGVLMNSALIGDQCSIILQGIIENPNISSVSWNFNNSVDLWVDNGILVSTNPHIQNPTQFPVNKQPIAKVLSNNSINFITRIGGQEIIVPAIQDINVDDIINSILVDENGNVVTDGENVLTK